MPELIDTGEIQITSTSLSTANATPILLKSTDRLRLQFVPTLVENPNSPEKCVSGKLVYEQKRKNDVDYPTDMVTRGSIKSGEYMEIALRTSETYDLFKGLQQYYALFEEMGQIPLGESSFTRIDRNIKTVIEAIKTDPTLMRNIANQDILSLVQQLLRVVITSDSKDDLLEVLSSLEAEGIDKLTNVVSIDKLNRIQQIIKNNLDNNDEEFWQQTFKANSWILSQIFASPMTIIEDKAYVGGKTIDNKGGHICDFLYANEISKNISLIEIKTPCTSLIGKEYRNNIYSMSNDLSGAVSQILTYKDSLIQEYSLLCRESGYKVLNPTAVIIIGKIFELSTKELSSFELFRNNLSGIIVVTYDELLGRIEKLISMFSDVEDSVVADSEGDLGDLDDDFPF